jgi:hypothetical protein
LSVGAISVSPDKASKTGKLPVKPGQLVVQDFVLLGKNARGPSPTRSRVLA